MNKPVLYFLLGLSVFSLLYCKPAGGEADIDKPAAEEEVLDAAKYYVDEGRSLPFSWSAQMPTGGNIDPTNSRMYKSVDVRGEKFVGIFYFTWHGCHGYDVHEDHNDVQDPSGSVGSPYDNSELLKANPDNPQYGPVGACHHWGKPYLDYYVAGDPWVVRKHVQMLSDAGVDVMLLDVTNGYSYLPIVKRICETMMQMRADGCRTPQIAFVLNANVPAMFNELYDGFYGQNLYPELWFKWLGKPLILANALEVNSPHKDEFTYRQSWFVYTTEHPANNKWFGNGEDKWAWGAVYPQQIGMHNGVKESMAVMPATHPTSSLGRSYNGVAGVQPAVPNSGAGIYFETEWGYALQQDPQFIFITGWNEWIAMRFLAEKDMSMAGKTIHAGDTYFVDQYNHEFSRDLEPLADDFGDNYYYMMVNYIRMYKGVKGTPTFSALNTISIDGEFSDWSGVKSSFSDDKGDITARDHFGYGSVGRLTNNTGRNDIVNTKTATDGTNLYFYVRCASDITPSTDPDWMKLFIKVSKSTDAWEGFQFAVKTPGVLEKSKKGWSWEKVGDISWKVSGKEMELAIPCSALGIADSFTAEFKWIDNAASDGDIQTCMRDGDSAPNGRFRYIYSFQKSK